MDDFKDGDEVVLAREFTWHGETKAENSAIAIVPVGTIGTVSSGKGSYDNGTSVVVSVDWHDAGEYKDGLTVDAACIEHYPSPVTDEEMSEVYRILGVSHE